jgi:hypothetical protein
LCCNAPQQTWIFCAGDECWATLQAIESGSQKAEGPLRLLRRLLVVILAALISVAAVNHHSTTSYLRFAVQNGDVLRLEGERIALHLVRPPLSWPPC